MSLIYTALLVLLLLVNLMGAAVIGRRFCADYSLGKAAVVLLVCLVFVFTEHFIGLGRLHWLWPLSTAVSVYGICLKRRWLWENWNFEAAFLLGFFYAFIWRLSKPDIDAGSEMLADFSHIINYMQGAGLPPVDRWFPPHPMNCYYAFGHYGAALMGRWFALDPGTTYNLAYCVLTGLIVACAYSLAMRLCQWRKAGIWVVAAFLVGGTGAASVVMLGDLSARHPQIFASILNTPQRPVRIERATTPWSSMRFIGSYTVEANSPNPVMDFLRKRAGVDRNSASATAQNPLLGGEPPPLEDPSRKGQGNLLELPMEIFSYVVWLGDYHAPLAGFLIFTMSLLSATLLWQEPRHARAPIHAAILAGSVPVTVIVNTWSLPLQCFLAAAVFAALRLHQSPAAWRGFVYGGIGIALLCFPYIQQFAAAATGVAPTAEHPGMSPRILWVGWPGDPLHASLVLWLALFWPVVALLLLHVCDRQSGSRRWVMAAFWIFLLFFTEFFYVKDIYGALDTRFNSTLKWWPWVYAGIILTVAPLNLCAASRFIRWATVAVLFIVSTYWLRLAEEWPWWFCLTPVFIAVFTPLYLLGAFWSKYRAKINLPQLTQCAATVAALLAAVGLYYILLAEPQSWWWDRPHFGRLDGMGWLCDDTAEKSLITHLKARPDGIALQSFKRGQCGFMATPAVAMFAGKKSLVGWIGHEQLWRGYPSELWLYMEEIPRFYEGTLPDPLDWLQKNRVDYVLWLKTDYEGDLAKRAGVRQKIHEQIKNDFFWRDFYVAEPFRIGMWERKTIK